MHTGHVDRFCVLHAGHIAFEGGSHTWELALTTAHLANHLIKVGHCSHQADSTLSAAPYSNPRDQTLNPANSALDTSPVNTMVETTTGVGHCS